MNKFEYQLMKLSQKIDEVHPLLVLCFVDKAIIEPLCFMKSFTNQRMKIVIIEELKIRTLLNYWIAIGFVITRFQKNSFIYLFIFYQ